MRCYQCGKGLTEEQVVEGLQRFDEIGIKEPDFEGWAHCMGVEEDQEIREGNQILEKHPEWKWSIVVCRGCVEEAFENWKE